MTELWNRKENLLNYIIKASPAILIVISAIFLADPYLTLVLIMDYLVLDPLSEVFDSYD